MTKITDILLLIFTIVCGFIMHKAMQWNTECQTDGQRVPISTDDESGGTGSANMKLVPGLTLLIDVLRQFCVVHRRN